ncbi:MAG: hypothetical protein LBT43_18465 [Prevotella sp.]|jgi:hypothetical protein|nr:hypothetical protein [Prevotella sp.]
MFSDVDIETNNRLLETKDILIVLRGNMIIGDIPNDSREDKVLKGLFFVSLYGVLEYTVTSIVHRCIQIINGKQKKILELKPSLYSLLLDSECEAVASVRDKKWDKRYTLFKQIEENTLLIIRDDLFPASIGNIKYKQLESIWRVFGIDMPISLTDSFQWKLSSLVDRRNAIAHGRELPSNIGGAYTISSLEELYNDISAFCSYIQNVFEDYINNEGYLK